MGFATHLRQRVSVTAGKLRLRTSVDAEK